MTDDRKRNTGGEVELLPLPEWTYGGNHLRLKSAGLQQRVEAYARANVDRALAESRAEVAELRESWSNARDVATRAEARAERLAEALRDFSNAVERLAFQMRAPNQWTPQFVQLAVTAKQAALSLEPNP